MKGVPERLASRHLDADELALLPARIKAKFDDALGATQAEWILVAGDRQLAGAAGRLLHLLAARASVRVEELGERRMEQLLDVILEDTPLAEVEANIEIDNVRLRAEFLTRTPTLTAAQIRAGSGLNPRNRSEPASRWKREARIFAVRCQGRDRYPAFQFQDGSPRPAIKDVLAALPDDLTPWQTALWFTSANGWLQGATPQECLDDGRRVVYAARQLARPALG